MERKCIYIIILYNCAQKFYPQFSFRFNIYLIFYAQMYMTYDIYVNIHKHKNY